MIHHRHAACSFNIHTNVLMIVCLLFLIAVSYCVEARATVSSSSSSLAAPNGPLSLFVSTIKEARRHLAAAAVARSVSIFAMYPIDTIKTRIQMEQANALRLTGLYRGVSGSLFGQVPYGVLTFGSYEMYKKTLSDKFPNTNSIFLVAVAAIMGDLTGSGWLCPSEVVKQQMQAGMYSTTGEAIRKIWKTKGLAGLYQGYFGGVARDVPFRVAQLVSFETTKRLYLRIKKDRLQQKAGTKKDIGVVELSAVDSAVCGAVAGTFSAAITSPLDRIKTLLMTDSGAYGGSVISCASQIWQKEGLAGFAAGVVPRVVYIGPSVAIFFIVYEQVQQRLSARGNETSVKEN